tara:strand:+ start:660 stop:1439 length:780 start_codon:yes stop_codon:yes gene_type:complete
MKVVSKLRDPKEGCPWDLKQTHNSLIPYVLEEAHEVADAIREGQDNELIEELGDLLLQIILHSQIASEEQRFNFSDVIEGIEKKLIRRHPHVFGNEKIRNVEELKEKWEQIKSTEKQLLNSKTPISESLKKKSRCQNAIKAAMIISKKAANIGFEWNTVNKIWAKFNEEIIELKHELESHNMDHAQKELGDVLFTLINIARWYKLNAEEGLASTNKKFLERFSYMESKLGNDFTNQSIKELENKWKESKEYISSKQNDE